jgi:putative ABC transport system permease protein
MIKSYLTIAWRNVWKNKFYTGINILGLALSIGCSIILFQFIAYHLSFDTYHHDAKQVYKLVTEQHDDDGSIEYQQGAPIALATAVQTKIPQVKDVAVFLRMHNITVAVPQNSNNANRLFAEHENIAITDGHFFNQFDYQWEQGTSTNALNEPNTVVLSHGLAQKYFGSQDVVGKSIIVDNKNTFKVTGVIKDHPANTDIKADIFLSLSTLKNIYPTIHQSLLNDWAFINSTNGVYLSIPPNVQPAQVTDIIAQMAKTVLAPMHLENAFRFKLQPLNEVHFDGRYKSGVIQKSLLTTLGIVGMLLIFIACVNFINMATAQSFKRAKEIGTRKVLGSSPSAIFLQFITETSYIVLCALLIAILWINLFLPVLNSWLQTTLSFNFLYDRNLLAFILLITIVITLAAGAYPALILSRVKPINALKNQINSQTRTSSFTRKSLIVLQNVIAQVLIISAVLITLQINYVKTTELGFDKSAVLMLPIPDNAKSKTDQLRNQLMTYPGIRDVSICYNPPSSLLENGGSIKHDGHDWEKFVGFEKVGDANYIKTFGIKLIAGRNLIESDTAKEYLVNEMLAQKLGAKYPQQIIGHRFTAGNLTQNPGTIVGVIKDFHSQSLYTAIAPEYITTSRANYKSVGVKLNTTNTAAAIAYIKNEWQSVYPQNVFEYHFLDEQIADFYQKEDLLNKLIRSSAIIAIAISCLGLLGLISLLTIQRTKEIGIRKVLGASIINITALISADFLKLVFIAIIIGSPIAWIMINKYLQSFAYRIEMHWWIFALTALIAILIAFLTVSYQAIKAAVANPIESLRSE